ncbi:MAG: hypothetical protein ACRDLT_10630 [Solirubrobacteraceae bacterium]
MTEAAIVSVSTLFWLVVAGWAFALLTFALLLRIIVFYDRRQRLYEDVFIGSEIDAGAGAGVRNGLAVGAAAPDMTALALAGGKRRLSALWEPSGVTLLFLSPNCEHCTLLLRNLAARGPDGPELLVVVSDSSPARTTKWMVRHLPEGHLLTTSAVSTAGPAESVLRTYNPRGVFPYFCRISASGKVIAAGAAVPARAEWLAARDAALAAGEKV